MAKRTKKAVKARTKAKAKDQAPGVVNGQIPDEAHAKQYFFHLIGRKEGQPANDWQQVLTALPWPDGYGPGIRPDGSMPHYAMTKMSGAGGVRGRIFLPTAEPDDLGYYTRQIQVIRDGPSGGFVWSWDYVSGNDYAPVTGSSGGNGGSVEPPTGGGLPVPPSGGGADLDAIIAARIEAATKDITAAVYRQGKEIAALQDKLESAGGGQQLPKRIALKSDHGRYLTAEDDGRVSNRETEPAGWQQWQLEVVE